MRASAALALAAVLATGTVARADPPGADGMPAARVEQKLMDGRSTSTTSFEADDGHREGEGVKAGTKMQFHADAKAGAITSEKPSD